MAVSDFNIYYQRKFRKNGLVIIEDEEHVVSQIYNNYYSKQFPLNAYQMYFPNKNIFSSYPFFENIYAYYPGQIYIDDWYYKYDDFAIQSYYQHIASYIDGTANNSLWDLVNSQLAINSNFSTCYILYPDPGILGISKNIDVFWYGDDGSCRIFLPLITCRVESKTSNFVKKMNIGVSFRLIYFNSSVNIDTLEFEYIRKGNTLETNVYAEVNGVRKLLVYPEYNIDGLKLYEFNNMSLTRSQVSQYFSSALDDFKKIKYYVIAQTNATFLIDYVNDNITYGKTNSTITLNSWNYQGFLIDVSESAFSPIQGFLWARGSVYTSYLKRIDNDGGPDANNPNHTKDPNDRDPGHGPGGSSGDKGGNGDHDNTSDKILPPGIPTLSGSGVGLFTIFNPTASQLAELGKKLWNPTALQAIKQYFSSPMETILGLGIIPVQPRQGSAKNILLGVYDTEISCTTVSSDYVIKDCGSISINRYYGSYLDYDPYTRISLYLPYIGEIQIDPDEVMQSVLGVQYYVNVVTGDCVAIVTSDGSIVYTAAGNCIRQLPIGQTDYSNIINTAVSAVSTIATAVAGGSAASSVGNAVAGAAKSEAGKKVAEARASSQLVQEGVGAGTSLINQVMQSKMRYNHAGSIGVGSGQLSYQKPYLTIERPNLDLADNYKSFVGYPCNETMQLSHCSGFTQIESCKLSVSGATDGELTEILAFLTEGVII